MKSEKEDFCRLVELGIRKGLDVTFECIYPTWAMSLLNSTSIFDPDTA